MKRKYLVVYEVGTNNLSGFIPDVAGVISTGKTLDEIRSNMREAVEFHLDGLRADGDEIPEARTTTVDFAHEDPDHGVLSCVVEWLEVSVPQMQSVA